MGIYVSNIATPHRTLTERERRQLLTGERRDGYRDHILYSMALATGLREHELAGLKVGDVFEAECSSLVDAVYPMPCSAGFSRARSYTNSLNGTRQLHSRGLAALTSRLAKIMGHSSTSTTERYAHLAPDFFGAKAFDMVAVDLSKPAAAVLSLHDVAAPLRLRTGTARGDIAEHESAQVTEIKRERARSSSG